MLKAIKIPEEAYKEAKKLGQELEAERAIEGVYKVSLSTAVSFAIKRALTDLERKKSLRMAAGGWKDLDTDKMIKEIYEGRLTGTKRSTSFD